MKVAKGHEMRAIDQYTICNLGLPGIVLMENAAMAVVSETINQVREIQHVVICCGVGNNGGDGFAIARILRCNQVDVKLILVGDEGKLSGDARINYQVAKNLGIPMISCETDEDIARTAYTLQEAGLIYDALFGTGLCRKVTGIYEKVIDHMNQSGAYVISIDIPSGIHSDTGQVLGVAVQANRTVTFCLPKIGLLLYPGTDYVGELVVGDIGIPDLAVEAINPSIMFMDDYMYKALLPARYKYSHKGTYGKTLIIAGTTHMAGAAVMTALAAYRGGTGLVKVFIEEEAALTIPNCIPEAIIGTYSRKGERLTPEDLGKLEEELAWADAVAIGPGLGNDAITRELLEGVLEHYEKTVVIDADGINALASDLTILDKAKCQVILTPHLGEMARLQQCSITHIADDLIGVAEAFSQKHGVVCVLKSARTIISMPQRETCVNIYGNSGMATAGSGDVLTGIIVSMLAQGMAPYESALLGVYLHSKAGDRAKHILGEYSLMATDLIRYLPEVMK